MSRFSASGPVARAIAVAAWGVLAGLAFAASAASAQDSTARRVALVVGNDSYTGLSPLRNAVNDAQAVAAALDEVGFAVTRVEDATRERLVEALDTFAGSLRSDDVALFYFAGHGVQIDQTNYLIPTDYTGNSAMSLRLNALSAAFVEEELREARVAMLVFDACRDNPYRGVRTSGGGLAPMEPRGTLIAYAAGSGQVAADAAPGAANGLFTAKFVEALRVPGLGASELFRRVRREVYAASGEEQFPAVYDGLLADFVFRRPGMAPDPAAVEASLGLDAGSRRTVQRGLVSAGFAAVAVDGVFGPATRAAIRAWQTSRGAAPTGYLDASLLAALGVSRPGGAGGGAPGGGSAGGSDRDNEAAAARLAALLGRDLSAIGGDENGWTDLHYAAALNLPGLARDLLDDGAFVDAPLYVDGEPISDRVWDTLREFGSPPRSERGNTSERDGATPLHVAARSDAGEVAGVLLGRGANVHATTATDGWTPLHAAASRNARGAADVLLGRGANVEAVDNDGNTPLHIAARHNAAEVAGVLLGRGANVHATTATDGWTPLHAAARFDAGEAAGVLLGRGANVHATMAATGLTPLHLSAWGNAQGAANVLLGGGAKVEATGNTGLTPLHLSAWVNAPGFADVLLVRGANVEATDNTGNTPLHFTTLSDAGAVAEVLLVRGANVEATDNTGNTPLHSAARRDAGEVAGVLLGRGANVEATNNRGYTPLHYAAWQNSQIAVVLLERGASVNAEAEGRTPLAMVSLDDGPDAGDDAMGALLRRHGAR